MISVNHNMVADDLSDFPVLIKTVDSDFAVHALSSGDDFVFINDAGVRLAHEIEYFNDSTGELVCWVNVSSLSSSEDTVLYMYYGNVDAENMQNSTGVWDDDFVMVQHLHETSGVHYDSTGYVNNGSCSTTGVNQDAVGMVDGADSLDGSGYVVVDESSGDFDIPNDLTISAWVKPVSYSEQYSRILHKNGAYGLNIRGDQGSLGVYNYGGAGWTYSDADVVTFGPWQYVSFVKSATGGISFYVNGVAAGGSDTATSSLGLSDVDVFVGMDEDGTTYPFEGSIDEVRVSKAIRSFAWVNTSYLNQVDSSNFITVGIEELSDAEQEYKISLHSNWNLVSFPVNESISKSEIIVSCNGANYSWSEASNATNNIILDYVYGYDRSSDSYVTVDTFDPGFGYWVYAFENCSFTVSSNAAEDDYITLLDRNWSIISLPCDNPVAKEDLIILYNGTEYSWFEATTDNNEENEPLILGFIYKWHNSNQQYLLADILSPSKGYWMYAYYDCTLKK